MNKKKSYHQQREELSDEGKQLWDKMMGEEVEEVVVQTTQRKTVIKEVVVESDESMRMRLEIKKMQQNSRIVIEDCKKQQKLYIKREEYFKANECRVVILCHTNLIERLQRILDGKTAFEKDFDLDENNTSSIFVR